MFDFINWTEVHRYMQALVLPALVVTLRIMAFTMLFSLVFGFAVGCIMVFTHPKGLRPNKWIYNFFSFFVNLVRSFPFIILIVTLAPITRLIVGTMIGEKAAIFPLSVGGIAFISRLVENALIETSPELIEAARSFGASDLQILLKVMIKENVPNLINTSTLAAVNCVGATAMAGAVGAGGLGSVALNFGFNSFNNTVLYTSVIIIFIIVQLLQLTGNYFYKRVADLTGKNSSSVSGINS